MRIRFLFLFLAFPTAFPPTAGAQGDPRITEAYRTAFHAGDARALTGLYADGAVVAWDGRTAMGTDSILAFWRAELPKVQIVNRQMTRLDPRGNVLWSSGYLVLIPRGSSSVQRFIRGYYLMGLRFIRSGTWLICFDGFSQSRSALDPLHPPSITACR